MRVLVLSCNTGEGHNTAGKAVQEQVRAAGHEADMYDMMLLAGKRTSRLVGDCYVGMVTHAPYLFHALYRAGEHISSSRRKSPVYYANCLMAKHLAGFLEHNPYDIIVTPHLFPAETATYMKKHHMLSQRVVAVATDYTCIPFWEETDCDYYILPHRDLAQEFADKGVPAEKLVPLGIPVGGSFAHKKDKQQARIDCGLPADRPAYLVMSGSMGFGRVNLFAAELVKSCREGEQVVILCGRNKRMRALLDRQFASKDSVHVVGYTNRVSDYMDACDVVFTKPGGLSSTEAAAKRIPIVHTAPIPGCETRNVAFFTSRDMSVSARKIGEQVACGNRLLHDRPLRERMIAAQQRHVNADASQALARFLETLAQAQGRETH